MPYIELNVTPMLGGQQKEQIKSKMGETITLIPGKSEAVTMVGINDGRALYLNGRELSNGAFIELRLLGKAERLHKEALTEAIFTVMADMLGMDGRDIYINIIELESWGHNGRLQTLG